MEYPQLEYRPIDDQWGQIWAGDDCIVPKIFWRYGKPIVQAVNSHEKFVMALRKYADHRTCCDINLTFFQNQITGRPSECTCGFEQALKEADKQ